MKQKSGQLVFSVLFFICLLGFFAANAALNGPALLKELKDRGWGIKEPKQTAKALEEIMSQELFLKYPLLEGYGLMEVLMGKKEDNAFSNLKAKDGMLYEGNFWSGMGDDQKELAARARRLHDQLKSQGTEMGVVLFPMKTPEEEVCYQGLPYDTDRKQVKDMAAWLRYYHVPVLDLGDLCEYGGLMQQEAFFATDHHWTPRGAFEGYCRIVEFMNQTMGASLDPEKQLRDLSNYRQETFPDYMFGFQGRQTGRIFAGGPEDYTVICPGNPGSFLLKRGRLDQQEIYEGTFREALLKLEEKEEGLSGIYDGRGEAVYLHNGVDQYVSIRNQEIENGKKILLLRDSYATPVGAFLAQSFEQVDLLWTLEVNERELGEFLESNQYDYVLLALFPKNLSEQAFPFGKEATP